MFPKALIIFLLIFSLRLHYSHCNSLTDEFYDFIVVGGGVGGSVVASRLSEGGHFTVLLLEAGGLPSDALFVPALVPIALAGSSSYVKKYKSFPQENVAGTNGGVVIGTVGRTLGGGSAVNGMLWNRGHPEDYNAWVESTGDASWSYENMLKYFKKAENYEGDFPSDHLGFGGPITVSSPKYRPGMDTILSAAEYLGYPLTRGPNAPQSVGFSPMEYSKGSGRRVSAFTGYILPYLNTRQNLKVIAHAVVKNVLFDGANAIGVMYASAEDPDSEIFARVKKEVILSAGALETPMILMRSGIGPREELEKANIHQVIDLPVGLNLRDHPAVSLHFLVSNKSEENVFIPQRDLNMEAYQQFLETGDGPFSTLNGATTIAFLTSSTAIKDGESHWPDLQVQLYQCPMRTDVPGYLPPGVAPTTEEEHDFPVNEVDRVSVLAMIYLTRPRSKGSLSLNVTDIYSDPLIDFNYFSDPGDMKVILEGIQKVLQIYEDTPSFQRQQARYRPSPLRACFPLPYRSEEYWRCFVKQTAHFGGHPSGTCKMGRGAGDPSAVVDTTLTVIGTNNLRVVDASVMPMITNSNTQAPTYAIAEKTAEIILQKWEDEKLNHIF